MIVGDSSHGTTDSASPMSAFKTVKKTPLLRVHMCACMCARMRAQCFVRAFACVRACVCECVFGCTNVCMCFEWLEYKHAPWDRHPRMPRGIATLGCPVGSPP